MLISLAAIIVYRLPWTWQCSKLVMKFIHAGLNLLAFVLAVISLVAVFDFHNAAKIPNMYSLHSWLGLIAVILYCLQVNSTEFYILPLNELYCSNQCTFTTFTNPSFMEVWAGSYMSCRCDILIIFENSKNYNLLLFWSFLKHKVMDSSLD